MQKLVWINSKGTEINLTSGDYGITEWEGFSACDVEVQTQNVPFQDGSVFLDALLNNRELSVTLAINDGTDLEKRYRLRRELISALNPKLGEGYLIYTNDFIIKRIKCLAQMPVFPTHNSDKAGTPKASLSWTACDPYWEDVEETNIYFGIDKQPIIDNEGDVPAQVKIDFFTSGVTNPKITNLKTNKFIKYNGSLTEDLQIDTNIGNKSVISEKLNFDKLIFCSSSLESVIYSKALGLYVAVGSSIFTSKNGKDWEVQLNPTSNILHSIVYSESLNLFIAVGNHGTILTSTNGIDWVLIESGISTTLNSVVFSEDLNLFVAVGENGTIITSSNGTSWNSQTSGINTDLFSITTCNSIYFKLISVGDEGKVRTSVDGITWSSGQSGIPTGINDTFRGVLFAEGLYVIIGQLGRILISSNGLQWTLETSGTNQQLWGISYSEILKKFVVTGENGIVLTGSGDGTEWTLETSGVNKRLYSSFYSEDLGLYIIVGTDTILSSSDCINWTNYIQISSTLYSITYSEKLNLFVGVGYNNIIATSSDGINWITQRVESTLSTLKSVTYSNKLHLFIAVGTNGLILSSSNGTSWNTQSSGINNTLNSIIYCEFLELFIAVGNNGKIITSNNGIDWNLQSSGASTDWNCITYSKTLGLFVVVGGYRITTSSDGINWTVQTTSYNNYTFKSVGYSESLKKFFIVGTDSIILTSSNGFDWSGFLYDITTTLNVVLCEESTGIILIIGTDIILISYNGVDWENRTENIRSNFLSAAYSKNKDLYIITGSSITIITSNYINIQNQIKNITPDSNMNFNLDTGRNQLRLNKSDGSFRAKLSYRQKYIGV